MIIYDFTNEDDKAQSVLVYVIPDHGHSLNQKSS